MKNLLYFGVGLIVGAATGAFGMKFHLDHKNEVEFVEVPEKKETKKNEKKHVDVKTDENSPKGSLFNIGPVINEESEHPVDSDEDDELYSENEENPRINEELTKKYYEKRNLPPEIIPFDMVSDLDPSIDTEILYYYMYDSALVDEFKEEIHGWENFLGNCLEISGFVDNNIESIFILNYKHNTLYEVHKEFKSWREENEA